MLSTLRALPLTAQILLSVSAVLIAGETIKVVTDIAGDKRRIETNGELRGNAALDMLEAVHVQAMLNRGQIEDGDRRWKRSTARWRSFPNRMPASASGSSWATRS